MLIAHLVVMALFFLIEILPVTVKVLLNLQPPTAYEVVAQARDDDLIEAVRAGQTEARRIEEGRPGPAWPSRTTCGSSEVAAGKRGNQHVEAELTRILDLLLQEWKDQLRTQVDVDQPAAAGGSRPSAARPHTRPSSRLPPPRRSRLRPDSSPAAVSCAPRAPGRPRLDRGADLQRPAVAA